MTRFRSKMTCHPTLRQYRLTELEISCLVLQLEGHSAREIGIIFCKDRSGMKTILSRGRKKLAKAGIVLPSANALVRKNAGKEARQIMRFLGVPDYIAG
jgi:DNA-binding CsgD family transcriptional regulator